MSPSTSSDLAGSPGPPLNSYPPRVRESETQVDPTSSSAHSTTILNGNASTLASVDDIYYFYKPEQMAFLWILLAMIVVGNSSVLVHTALFAKNRKSRMNFFIMHLAIADLLVGVINVPTDIAWRITVDWRAGNVACKVVKFLQVLVTYSSTYVLVSLSIDRYDAIKNPLNFSRRWRRARLLIASAWGLSVIFSLPAIFLNQETIVRGHPQCWIDLERWQWQMYITLVASSLFFIPAIIITACYSIIVSTIWRKGRSMGNMTNYSTDSSSVATTVYIRASSGATESTTIGSSISKQSDHEGDNRQRVSSRGVIPQAKIKSIKMTLVIVFVFVLCWSPYFVWDLLQVYGFIPLTQQTIAISTFIQSLAPLNSAANPLIYLLFTRSTRNPSTCVTCITCCTTILAKCRRRRSPSDDINCPVREPIANRIPA